MVEYKNGKIYKVVNTKTHHIYIGSTTQSLSRRMACHRAFAKRGTDTPFYSAMSNLGIDNFRIKLIERFACKSREDLISREYQIMSESQSTGIEIYNSCVNGYMNEQTKAKMSRSHLGKVFTPEHRKNLSRSNPKQQLGKFASYHNSFKRGCVSYITTRNTWAFAWRENNKSRCKSFSVAKYGEREARQLAEDFRNSIYPE